MNSYELKLQYSKALQLLKMASKLNGKDPRKSFSYLEESKNILQDIIDNYSNTFDVMTGVYISYTSCLCEIYRAQFRSNNPESHTRHINYEQYETLLKYNNLAGTENPLRETQELLIHALYGSFDKVLNIWNTLSLEKKIEVGNFIPALTQNGLWRNWIRVEALNKNINYDKIRFLEAMITERLVNTELLHTLSDYYSYMWDKSEIEKTLRFYEKESENNKVLQDLLWEDMINLYGKIYDSDKVIKYCESSLKQIDGPDKQKRMNCVLDILASAYMHKGNFEKSYEVRQRINKKFNNNTYLHNMGLLLYKMKEYKEAEQYIKKALYIYEDETSLNVLGDIYFASKEYAKALDTYRRTLAFTENNNTGFVVKDGRSFVISQLDVDNFDSVNIKIYENIVYSYIQLKEYDKALAYNEIAKSKFIHESSFIKNDMMLETLIEMTNDIKSREKIVQDAILELEREKEIVNKRSGQIRDWAKTLCDIQEDLDINQNWGEFENKILKLSESLYKTIKVKDESKKRTSVLRKKYPTLEPRAMKFLCTAENLYMTYENDLIDYAPVIIEFCKVVEVELNDTINKITRRIKKRTLGELMYTLKEKGSNYITDQLETLVNIRNKSAHSGECSREDMNLVRSIVLDELIETLLKMKRNKSFIN